MRHLAKSSLYILALLAMVCGSATGASAGLVSWWPATRSQYRTANDAIGLGAGTLKARVDYALGKVVDAFVFDGSGVGDNATGYVDLGAGSGNFGTSAFTLMLWMKAYASAHAVQPLIAKGVDGDHLLRMQIEVLGPDPGKVQVEVGDGTLEVRFTSNRRVDDGQWHHLMLVREDTRVRLRIDGVFDSEASTSAPIDLSDPAYAAAPLALGGDLLSGARYAGLIDEVQLYDSAMTSNIAWWPGDIGDHANDLALISSGYEPDCSGNNNNAIRHEVMNKQGKLGDAFGLEGDLNLDGQGSYVEIPASPSMWLLNGAVFTLAAWINPQQPPATRQDSGHEGEPNPFGSTILARTWTTGNPNQPGGRQRFQSFNLFILADGALSLSADGGGIPTVFASAPGVISYRGQWQHVAVVLDPWRDWIEEEDIYGQRKQCAAYVNGQSVDFEYVSGSSLDSELRWPTPTTPLSIGRAYQGFYPADPYAAYFVGMIDEVQAYSKVLPEGEIQKLARRRVNNHAPELTVPGAQQVIEGVPLSFSVSATDPNAFEEEVAPVLSAAQLPPGASFDANTGIFSWTPDPEQAGRYTVRFTATDGQLSDGPRTVEIQVEEGVQAGTGVAATPVDPATGTTPVQLNFEEVTQAGGASLSISSDGPIPPANFSVGDPPIYYDLHTTATFSGAIDLSFSYSGLAFSDESHLRLFHFENNTWTDVTTAVDTGAKIITGRVTSLSPFAIFEASNQPPTLSISGGLALTVDEGQMLTFTVTASDPDAGQTVAIHTSALPAGSTFDGVTFSWVPSFLQAGTYAVSFVALDNGDPSLSSPQQTVAIAVNNASSPDHSTVYVPGYTALPDNPLGATHTSLLPNGVDAGLDLSGAFSVQISAIGCEDYGGGNCNPPNAPGGQFVAEFFGADGNQIPLPANFPNQVSATIFNPIPPGQPGDPNALFTGNPLPVPPGAVGIRFGFQDSDYGDNAGLMTVTTQVSWTQPVNQAPMASAGPDQTVEATGPTTSVTLHGEGSSDADGGVLSYSWSENSAEISSQVSPTLSLTKGIHTFTLTLSDGQGGSAADQVVVNIVDTTAPTLTLNGVNPLLLELGTLYTEPGASALDVVDGDLTANIQISGSVDANTEGSYTITYTVSDAAHNSASATRTVKVVVTPNSYGLIATHSLHLRQNARVLSGFAGVVNQGAAPFLAGKVELVVGARVQTDVGVRLSAPRVRVRKGADIEGTLVYNQLVSVDRRASMAQQEQVPSSYFPLFQGIGLPAFLTATPGTQDVEVKQKKSATLSPGAYDEVRVKQKGTLTFSGGTYHLGDLEVGPNAEIRFSAPTTLLIRGQLALDQGSSFGPASGSGIDASDILVYVEGRNGRLGNAHDDDEGDDEEDDAEGRNLRKTPRAAKIGVRVSFQGNLYAPNGTLHLRQGAACVGSFIARDIIVGVRTQVAAQSGWNTPGVVYQPQVPAPLAKLAGAQGEVLPEGTGLLANYPNPFNPTTTLPYVLSEAGLVKLSVYNVLGQQIRVLVDQLQVPGAYTVSWDGMDAAGLQAAGGVYFYRLEAGEHIEVRKMLFAK